MFTIALYYIMLSLSLNKGLKEMAGAATVSYTLGLGSQVIAIFAVIFLFYTNSFLMKRRKNEFGLFNILGMEKKHITKVIGFETLFIFAASLIAGLILGISFDKAMYLLILKLMRYDITLGFYVSREVITTTIFLFAVIFLLILMNSIRQIYQAKPIELLQSTKAGEREPKTKWLITFLGILCLGCGYYISVTIENPVAAIFVFFIAVILVIIGTYLLFTAGSITILKMLRKNKKYYYQTKHFTSISGMIYRMKQNAVGLANICILSTMVLVIISATTSMMIGVDEILNTRYPYDISVYFNDLKTENKQDREAFIDSMILDAGLKVTDKISYTYLNFTVLQEGNNYKPNMDVEKINAANKTRSLFVIPLSDYNTVTGENKTLEDDQVLIYSDEGDMNDKSITVCDKTYQVTKQLSEFVGKEALAANTASTDFIIVKDMEELKTMDAAQKAVYGKNTRGIRNCYGLNMTGSKEEQAAAADSISKQVKQRDDSFSIDSKAHGQDSLFSLYGGFFFVGIFLGLIFIMATVLIIYYKQISEGYDDKDRYDIMQKVGMSHGEIKKSIQSQILTVFFLPLITAGIHVAFAFPVMSNILLIFNLTNTTLFISCTVICFLVFAVLYGIIYGVTAKSYYRIVSKRG